jgi:hypothetical protein
MANQLLRWGLSSQIVLAVSHLGCEVVKIMIDPEFSIVCWPHHFKREQATSPPPAATQRKKSASAWEMPLFCRFLPSAGNE